MRREFIIPISKTVRSKDTFRLKKEQWYKCLYCQREYKEQEDAEKCLDNHKLILVPIARNDLGRLNQFLYLKEDKLLTESVINIIKRYAIRARDG